MLVKVKVDIINTEYRNRDIAGQTKTYASPASERKNEVSA